jgi:hypothetical protein
MKGNSWRSSPAAGSGGDGRNRRRQGRRPAQAECSSVLQQNKERKGDRDSMGTTSKRARERQKGKETTRRTRWCAHLRPRITMATEELAGVGEDDGSDVGFA